MDTDKSGTMKPFYSCCTMPTNWMPWQCIRDTRVVKMF